MGPVKQIVLTKEAIQKISLGLPQFLGHQTKDNVVVMFSNNKISRKTPNLQVEKSKYKHTKKIMPQN